MSDEETPHGSPTPNPTVCPNCGACPTCGHSPAGSFYPSPWRYHPWSSWGTYSVKTSNPPTVSYGVTSQVSQ